MIRKATKEDAERIAEINVFGWRAAYRGIVSDRFLFKRLTVSGKAGVIYKSLSENADDYYVFEDEEIIKGFMICGKSRSEDLKDSYELYAIYVDPLLKGQGVGTELIKYLDDLVLKENLKSCILWVFKENDLSGQFYRKNGFTIEGKEEYLENFQVWKIRYIKEYA